MSFKNLVNIIQNISDQTNKSNGDIQSLKEAFDLMNAFFDQMEKVLDIKELKTKDQVLDAIGKVKTIAYSASKKDSEHKEVLLAIGTFMDALDTFIQRNVKN